MAEQNQQPNRKRVVHQLDTPFTTVSWPEITADDQVTILELLCNLISPLGQHRQTYAKPSKGKRAVKSEVAAKKTKAVAEETTVPPQPDLQKFIDVGFNAISRNLEAHSAVNGNQPDNRAYSMVFVARGNQASSFNCHFPQMIGAASRNMATENKIRLVGFSKPCSERLSNCLGIPRVSSIAILRDAPGAEALQDLVRKCVSPVEVKWIEEATDTEYLSTNIKGVETTVGPKRVKAEV